ncbi:MAG: S-layer homology domain-containing protein, partial [Oscillospiraceae bacterium]|nr:S-layer homology domain-containing protein [Oscillospiraceae bacterium]
MRNLKKFLALVMVVAMAVSFVVPAFAKSIDEYSDAAAAADALASKGELKEVYADAVQLMIDLSVMKGDGDTDNLRLGDGLSRAEFMVMLYKATSGGVAIENKEPSYSLMPAVFADTAGHWSKAYVNWAGTTGISAGYPGEEKNFKPDQPITFAEALLLCLKAIGFKTQNETGFVFDSQKIKSLAYEVGMLGHLYETDGGAIDRATACLLFDYTIFSEQIRYTYIGQRYMTGDDTVMAGAQKNPSWTLAEYAFHLVSGDFTIITDGVTFGLP